MPAGRALRGPCCPRPRRIIRRAVWKARLRGVLSIVAMVGVVGVMAAGGFWLLRGPVAAAGGDAAKAVESLLMAESGEHPSVRDAARSVTGAAVVVEAGTGPLSPTGAVVASD